MAGANALGAASADRRDRRPTAGPACDAGGRVQELRELRRAAAVRGVQDRILGARGGQAAADAARSGSSAARLSSSSAARSGIGREVALQIAKRGGHVVVADMNVSERRRSREGSGGAVVEGDGAGAGVGPDVARQHRRPLSARRSTASAASTRSSTPRRSIRRRLQARRRRTPGRKRCSVNVTSNYVLADEAAKILKDQRLPASIVLTSSANAVVPKSGSEPYDVSKAAINHLIRELAMGLGPLVRVNGIAPATVVAGSAMFPKDRVMVSLKKYEIPFDESESVESLAIKARRVLRAPHDHAAADSADRLRQRDLLARRRSEREDDGACDSRGWRVAGGVPAGSYQLSSYRFSTSALELSALGEPSLSD